MQVWLDKTQGYVMTHRDRKQVTCWLITCAALVFAMVLLGGAVRLTGSGLSMVDWQPIMGSIPPLTEQAWDRAFAQYRQFPEYKLVNHSITLAEFRFIYLMEFAHRLAGRMIGLVFLIPFLIFLFLRKIPAALAFRLWLLFLLGAMQGVMGWYMVRSGLVDIPAVSPYRLTAHLIIAVIIYAYMVRIVVGLHSTNLPRSRSATRLGPVLPGMILLMIGSGGFVAGARAGFIYNTFPMMDGQWIPARILALSPVWKNVFENPVTIQFAHRCLALALLILIICYAGALVRHRNSLLRGCAIAIFLAGMIQVMLGIATLLLKAPVALGVAHQAGALVLLTVALIAVFSGYPRICDVRQDRVVPAYPRYSAASRLAASSGCQPVGMEADMIPDK